ncbi:MAG: hoxW [Burkholderiaceae bacterium]|nr:hoxW [Burkholderiaceae bacterium]
MNACVDGVNTPSLYEFDAQECLILGIGNESRQDDGIGWAFIDYLEKNQLCAHAVLDRRYQLLVEDAEVVSRFQRVLLVDASQEAHVDKVSLVRIVPKLDTSFTSHAISPASILATCVQCFGVQPEVWFLTIKGYEWQFGHGLTMQAQANFQEALRMMRAQK